MSNPIKAEVVLMGRLVPALVYPEDPAYNLVQTIKRAGFLRPMLSVAQFATGTGVLSLGGSLESGTLDPAAVGPLLRFSAQEQVDGLRGNPVTVMSCTAHHWRLDTPATGNPEVTGRCIRCGQTRAFPVNVDWDSPQVQAKMRAVSRQLQALRKEASEIASEEADRGEWS